MVYRITKSDGSTLISSLADYTQDTSTSLTLIGRGVENYGQIIANDLVHLLENFSSATTNPPTGPLIGQLWYQNDKSVLTYWDGAVWRAIATSDGLNNAKFVSSLSLTGDAIGTSSNPSSGNATLAVSLASIGTAGTYVKVTTDTKGRVIAGGVLTSNDVSNALSYTPVQQGTGIGQANNAVKIGWSTNNKLKATVDLSDLGNIALESWALATFQPLGGVAVPTPVATPTPVSTSTVPYVQQGTGIGQLANVIKLGWSTGSKLKLTVDQTDEHNVALEDWSNSTFVKQGGGPGQRSGDIINLGWTDANTLKFSINGSDGGVLATANFVIGTFTGANAGTYQKFPSGLIIQAASGSSTTGYLDQIAFPIAFPTAIISIVVTEGNAQGWGNAAGTSNATILGATRFGANNLNGFFLSTTRITPTGAISQGNISYNYIAYGY